MRIKNWINDFISNREHSKNAKFLNKEFEERYYRPKSKTKDILLCEIYNKAGLSSFNIVPILFKLKYLHPKGVMIEKESGKRNAETVSEFLKDLENLELIKIVENNFYSYAGGRRYITHVKDLKIIVHLLPKGIDYVKELKRSRFDKYLRIILAIVSVCGFFISLWNLKKPNTENYKTLEIKIDSLAKEIKVLKKTKPHLK